MYFPVCFPLENKGICYSTILGERVKCYYKLLKSYTIQGKDVLLSGSYFLLFPLLLSN